MISDFQYSKNDCCLIGDSVNDKIAAETNNIDFYGYNNENLKFNPNYIIKFKTINYL